MNESAWITLDRLAPGRAAAVQEVRAAAEIAQRLADLGFVPGTRVAVRRRAPLGDPVEYELRGYRMCLRDSEARCVWVRAE